MIKPLLLSLILASSFSALSAQSQYTPYAPLALGETLINQPTPRVFGVGTWEIKFTHRFSQPINEGDIQSLWGLDSAADIGIGLTYVPIQDLQISLYRTDIQDDYELAAKWSALKQAPAMPVSLSFRAGADVRTEEGMNDRASFFAQALVSRRIGERIEIFANPSYVSNTDSFEHAVNLPLGAAYMLKPHLSAIIELIPPNGDLPSSIDSDFSWAIGLKRAIGGHYFEVLLSNSRATHVDQYVPGNFLGGLNAGDVYLGFNIERRFGGRGPR